MSFRHQCIACKKFFLARHPKSICVTCRNRIDVATPTRTQGADARPVAEHEIRDVITRLAPTAKFAGNHGDRQAATDAIRMLATLGDAIAVLATRDAAPTITPESVGLPSYPSGHVVGPCVCGSWPGGACLKCKVIPARDAAPSDAIDGMVVARLKESLRSKSSTSLTVTCWRADLIELMRIAASAPREQP